MVQNGSCPKEVRCSGEYSFEREREGGRESESEGVLCLIVNLLIQKEVMKHSCKRGSIIQGSHFYM